MFETSDDFWLFCLKGHHFYFPREFIYWTMNAKNMVDKKTVEPLVLPCSVH